MSDQVQHLIDRITKDAVETAAQQSDEVLAQARTRAAAIVAEAEAKANEIRAAADRQAKDLVQRGTHTLTQAARDLLLQVGDRFENMVQDILTQASGHALDADIVERILLRLADTFGTNGIAEGQVEVAVGERDRARLTQFVLATLRDKLVQGVTIVVDPRLGDGFRLSYAAGSIHHDFTAQAVARALAPLVRPQLAEIVLQAALDGSVRASVS